MVDEEESNKLMIVQRIEQHLRDLSKLRKVSKPPNCRIIFCSSTGFCVIRLSLSGTVGWTDQYSRWRPWQRATLSGWERSEGEMGTITESERIARGADGRLATKGEFRRVDFTCSEINGCVSYCIAFVFPAWWCAAQTWEERPISLHGRYHRNRDRSLEVPCCPARAREGMC